MSVKDLGGIGGSVLQVKPYRAARSNPVNGRYIAWFITPSHRHWHRREREEELKMDKEKATRPPAEHHHDESKTHVCAMTDSFGEGYSTRSEEEGFGCIYRCNDPVINPEYDKSQGSEVKEKEKARNQS